MSVSRTRFLSLFLALLLLFSSFPGDVLAAEGNETEADPPATIEYEVTGGKLYFNTDGVLTKCDQTVTAAEIPGSVGGSETKPAVAVKRIGDSAFSGCKELVSVNIPNSVTEIGNSAFSNCEKLTSVTLPDSVISLGNSAFAFCRVLENLTLSNGLEVIAYNTFNNCNALKEVFIPEGVTEIGASAFTYTPVTTLTLPASISQIGGKAFDSCDSLRKIIFNGTKAQWKTVTIGASNDALSNAFIQFLGDPEITYPATEGNLYFDADGTLSRCDPDVTAAVIPGTVGKPAVAVTQIGNSAFENCANLTSVSIPDSVTKIGSSAFSNCKKLTGITIPNNVTEIGNLAFSGCGELLEVTFPAKLNSIGDHAFSTCHKLREIAIPNSTKTIGQYAFYNCERITDVVLPDSVTSLGERAFQNCSALKNLTLSGGVTRIGNSAFSFCTGLDQVTIPDGVKIIGVSAFAYTGVTTLVLPTSVTWLENSAFNGCSKLAKIIYAGTEDQWKAVDIGNSNNPIFNAAIEYNGGTPPRDWLSEMTYAFSNTWSSFGYDKTYRIPYERYKLILGDTVRTKKIYNEEGAWYGSCSGMAGSSALFTQADSGITVSSFSSTASRPSDLKVTDTNTGWSMSLRDFIEAMQLVQYDRGFSYRQYWHLWYSLEEICDIVKQFQETGKDPIIIGVHGNEGGHALLAYGLKEVSDTESRLMVYDCNRPGKERYIKLDRDPASGNYTDWHYSLNDRYEYSSKTCGNSGERSSEGLDWMPASEYLQVWKNAMSSTENYSRLEAQNPGADSALLMFNSDSAVIRDYDGNLVATVKDGKLTTDNQNVISLRPLGILDGETETSRTAKTTLLLPADLYTVTSTSTESSSGSQKPFEATMVHVDQAATVSAPEGSTVTFAVTDKEALNSASVKGANSGDYAITLESALVDEPESAAGEETKFTTVTMTGALKSGGPAPSLTQEDGQLSVENALNAAVQINDTVVASDTLNSGGKLNLPAFLSTGLNVELQEDGRSVLFRDPLPNGVASIYAASYDEQGRMTEVLPGTLRGSNTVTFSKELAGTVRLFLLDKNSSPVSQSIPLTAAKRP